MDTSLKRILLVDDEPDIRMIATKALEAIGGFTVQTCCDGDEALQKAPDFDPELILMDVMMPGKDGPATVQELRQIKQLSNTPIVFMTARVQRNEIEEYFSLGAADVIPKPFDPMALAQQISAIWNTFETN